MAIAMSPQFTRARAVNASLAQRGFPPDAPERVELARTMRAERLLAAAREAVADWPPLTPEQVAKVTEILNSAA